MADWSLIAGLLGIAMGAGVIALIVGLRGTPDDSSLPRRRVGRLARPLAVEQPHSPLVRRRRVLALIAVAVGLVVWLISDWPVLGFAVAAGVVLVPVFTQSGGRDKRKIAKYVALEDWVRRIAGGITAGTGLTTALVTSDRQAQPAIYQQVRALSARLSARMDPQAALRQFADDLDDPLGDFVAAALIQILTLQSGGSVFVLTSLADTLAEEVIAARRIETERASPRLTVRIVVAVAVGMGVMMGVLTNYLQPYGTAQGQIALGLILLLAAGCMSWMWTKTTPLPDPRFMRDVKPSRWS